MPTLYNLSDEQVEYPIHDRLSFPHFFGLGIEDSIPDATEAKQGQIIDASIIPVPIPRNHRKEDRRIKDGEVPEDCGVELNVRRKTSIGICEKSGTNRSVTNRKRTTAGAPRSAHVSSPDHRIGRAKVKIGLMNLYLQSDALPAADQRQGRCARCRLKQPKAG